MTTTIQQCINSEMFFAVENGFRFDFPSSIANALMKFMEKNQGEKGRTIIGEWILSLPFKERMKVNIQLTSDRK